LENEHGGHLVDDVFVVLAGAAGFIEELMGFAGGEALVPGVDRQASERAEFGGELLHFLGARAGFAGEMEGVADDNGGDREAAGEAGYRAEIVASVAVDFEGEDGLGGEAEFVGDGHANALGADVETEVAGC
jgi:hypothetical protein